MKTKMQEAGATEARIAAEICPKLVQVMKSGPTWVSMASAGRFTVLVMGFPSQGCELRALLFRSERRSEQLLVQLNLTMQFFPSSPRLIKWTASYEELGAVYAGTPVQVLDGSSFAEFMRCYDDLPENLQGLLDGDDQLVVYQSVHRAA